jgi:outer membrane autotransporter protein
VHLPGDDGTTPGLASPCRKRTLLATVSGVALGLALASPAAAQDATWLANPVSVDFNAAANWSPATVPTGTALFDVSSATGLSILLDTVIGSWTLNAGASNYRFTNFAILDFNGAGIVINGGSATIDNFDILQFFNSSTAGSASIYNTGLLLFRNSSTAGSATITNSPGNLLQFLNSSTAGNATITNNGTMAFSATSSAGSATITNSNASLLQFFNSSTAGSATITTNNGGLTEFHHDSSGGSAAFVTNAGGVVDISTLGAAAMSAGSIAGAGNYFLGNKQLTVGSNNLSTTVSGGIADSGSVFSTGASLVKVGAGTLTLTNNNTYSGGTFLNGGTVAVAADGSLGAPTGGLTFDGGALQALGNFDTFRAITLNAGGGTFDTNGNTLTITGAVAGAGGLTKQGAGTLILDGANTYAGGTTVNAGVLRLGAGGSLNPLGALTVNAGGAFDLNSFSQAVGDLSGAGAVTLGSGTLTAGRAADTTFDGGISGPGGFVKQGAGTLIFTAANAYTGGTTIGGGTLQLGNGGPSGTIDGDVVNNSIFAINRSDDFTFGGDISGTGGFEQRGGGTTVLTGASTYSGPTTVVNGGLVVDGSLASTVTVNAGATLSGIGTIGGLIGNGTVAPGNSIGTLNVAGNVAFGPGSIYQVELNAAGETDRINATGTATLTGGTVQVLAATGNYSPAMVYTIVTAQGGRSGAFAGASSNFAFLEPTLSYDPNNVFLTLTRNAMPFPDAIPTGMTRNERATGAAVEALGFGNILFDTVVSGTALEAQRAFNALSGEVHASASSTILDESRYVRDAVVGRLRQSFTGSPLALSPLAALGPAAPLSRLDAASAELPALSFASGKGPRPGAAPPREERVLAAWGQVFSARGSIDGDGNAATVDRSVSGIFAGFDGTFDERWRFGLAGGYHHTSFDIDQRASSGGIDNYHIAAYGGFAEAGFAARAGFAYTWHDIDTRRAIHFRSFADTASAAYDAQTAQAFGEIAYAAARGAVALEPFAGLAFVALKTDHFVEQEGPAGLTGVGPSESVGYSTLGLRAAALVAVTERTALTVRGALGWRHAFGDVHPTALQSFTAGGVLPFSIAGVPIARDSLIAEAGLDIKLMAATSLGISYSGALANGADDHAGRANLTVRF